MKTSRWIVPGLLLLVALGLGVFWGLRREVRSPYAGDASLAELQRLPETNLLYPGSEVIDRLADEGGGLLGGRNPAYASYALGTQATPADVEAFYERRLRDLGWTPLGGLYNVSSTAETEARAWRKGNLIFRFAIRDKRSPLAPPDAIRDRYITLYDIQVRNLDSDER